MIRYKEIAFVAYPVTDIARARQFYEGVLNLKPNAPLQSEHPHWIEYDIGSGTLGIGSSPQWFPSQDGASVALEVETSMSPSRVCVSTRCPSSSDRWKCPLATWRPCAIQTGTS
jgi:hypothetical protein